MKFGIKEAKTEDRPTVTCSSPSLILKRSLRPTDDGVRLTSEKGASQLAEAAVEASQSSRAADPIAQ